MYPLLSFFLCFSFANSLFEYKRRSTLSSCFFVTFVLIAALSSKRIVNRLISWFRLELLLSTQRVVRQLLSLPISNLTFFPRIHATRIPVSYWASSTTSTPIPACQKCRSNFYLAIPCLSLSPCTCDKPHVSTCLSLTYSIVTSPSLRGHLISFK